MTIDADKPRDRNQSLTGSVNRKSTRGKHATKPEIALLKANPISMQTPKMTSATETDRAPACSSSAAASAAGDKDTKRPLRVLCVDDDEQITRVLQIGLTCVGHQADFATGAFVWLEQLSGDTISYDVIVTDHEMLGMTGLEFVRCLGERSFRGGILVYCSPLDSAVASAYRQAGVSRFLAKPAELEHFLSAVEAAAPAHQTDP